MQGQGNDACGDYISVLGKLTRCRVRVQDKQATGGHTDYIHGRCARQDTRAHTRDCCYSGLPPGARTQPTPVTRPTLQPELRQNLKLDITGNHSGRGSATPNLKSPGITRVRARAVTGLGRCSFSGPHCKTQPRYHS